MLGILKILSPVAAAFILTVQPGCGVGTAPIVPYPLQRITVAMPYVEAVHFPMGIHAGQRFAIEFDLSCVQFPNALRSPARPFPDVDLRYDDSNGPMALYLYLWRDVTYADNGGPLTTTVSLPIEGLVAGVHRLSYTAAATREDGGKLVQINRYDGTPMEINQPEFHELTFTVLP